MNIIVELSGEEVRQALFAHVLKHLGIPRACFDMEGSTVQTTNYQEIRDCYGGVTVTLVPPANEVKS